MRADRHGSFQDNQSSSQRTCAKHSDISRRDPCESVELRVIRALAEPDPEAMPTSRYSRYSRSTAARPCATRQRVGVSIGAPGRLT